jgi:hypothetical protein
MTLIGDHKQLPPVITSREALAGGLGISLFERLTEEGRKSRTYRIVLIKLMNIGIRSGTFDHVEPSVSDAPPNLTISLSRVLQLRSP